MKLFSLPLSSPVSLTQGKKVWKKEDFQMLLTAQELLKTIEQEGKQQKAQIEQEGQELKQKAQEEGKQEGLETFHAHLLALDAAAKQIYLDTQKIVLSLAMKAAQKIVKKELEMHPDTIVDIVMQAMAPAKQNKKVTIFVHRSDKEALEKEKNKLKDLLEMIQVLSIQENNDITPGGCIIETESGIINATLENQWKALEAAFEKHKK